jgi:hypothetical protein
MAEAMSSASVSSGPNGPELGRRHGEDPGDFIKWVAKVTGYKS